MTIEITPEFGVELPPDIPYFDLRERAEAACNSVDLLEKHGLEVMPTNGDKEVAAKLLGAYATNPEKASTAVNNIRDRKSTRLNSSHSQQSRMPSSA